MKSLTLILGGARSGKSNKGLKLAFAYENVLFVATAQAWDDEMRHRIDVHKTERPEHWGTLEAPQNVADALAQSTYPAECILLDDMTLLASNVILALGDDVDTPAAEKAVLAETERLLEQLQTLDADVIIVSNEVGLGIVPATKLGRVYRDALGRANQKLAQAADSVLFMVSGLPMVVK
ncbi:MAG: bifunctional adenosylcobinamide kinase/adenosylcobinamide-phosphate guanylyltransferase [Chloroflexota bacterium]